VTHTLRADGFDASEDGTGRGTPWVPVAFAIQAGALRENADSGPDGVGVQSDHAYTLEARAEVQAVATLAIRGRGDDRNLEYRTDGTANALLTPNGGRGGIGVGAVQTGMAVRRLTPRECERLQGFPDGYTAVGVPMAGEASRTKINMADGPRYKALGNSMAVPVMAWIGRRIQQFS
jgi:DNA (cytosine-5)-methyltransferase 1